MLKSIFENHKGRGWHSERRPCFQHSKGTGLPIPQGEPSEVMCTLSKHIRDFGVRGNSHQHFSLTPEEKCRTQKLFCYKQHVTTPTYFCWGSLMRNWHPYRLEWQEYKISWNCLQILMLQATLNALCCSRRAFEWGGGKANQKSSQEESTNRKPSVPFKHL